MYCPSLSCLSLHRRHHIQRRPPPLVSNSPTCLSAPAPSTDTLPYHIQYHTFFSISRSVPPYQHRTNAVRYWEHRTNTVPTPCDIGNVMGTDVRCAESRCVGVCHSEVRRPGRMSQRQGVQGRQVLHGPGQGGRHHMPVHHTPHTTQDIAIQTTSLPVFKMAPTS